MKLSAKTFYSVKILIEMSLNPSVHKSIQDIAANQDLSVHFVEQVMPQLKSAGFVKSVRGANGGYELIAPASQIHIAEVAALFENNFDFVDSPAAAEEFLFERVYVPLKQSMAAYLGGISLEQLSEEYAQMKNGQMFYI